MRHEKVSTGNLPAKAQHAGGVDFLLACQTDFRQNQVPRVAAKETKPAKIKTKETNMKIVLGIFIALACVLLLLFMMPRILAFKGRREVPEMTPEKAQELFQSVGGRIKVNQEAGTLFGQLRTNDWRFLDAKVLTNCPAISALYLFCENYSGENYSGTSATFNRDRGPCIEIKFGNHWSLKRIFIFDSTRPITFSPDTNWFQMTSNIFVSK